MPPSSASAPVILALETATTCGSLALVAEGRCLAEYSLNTSITHSRRLLSGIDWLLAQCELSWPHIGAIAVSLGPGSFTGLRIALSTAKGLCMATGKPLLGVGTLDGLAGQFPYSSLPICPVVDARKNEIYTALYRCNQHGVAEKTTGPMVIKPERLQEFITTPTLLVGDGLPLYGQLLKELLGESALLASPEICFARAAAIGSLAWDLFRQGSFLNPATAVPIYVRASDAELHFGERKKIQS
ncbi:MAG: tRNA (adenosine(37)-N6)-threonylcarbamoyltransferase complex dimerization subunit type 1 TsaB [Desulfurivibrionaceae bacterium]|jgi:tRNA threonylcarbamoyladenosine biosynthesis protein TsaB|nr:tRNA (adenosine(37)-N6)-threonylcarbamoyltransferase complex dimerization subunit type 1 TsaB [Pseudomonadota bacterium]MCG2824127.1 tRNA (adenosine(37)-N6)-threonylcarbamoyltransferase complex dimerization subunit type 1 TsaB [Desulfobulbaceae bacterium]MDP2003308.1 tRNA (adenosine(37)-N6)-threonylcarbamoyltransferase complex dimerization subunit type 1 TsaB [Desulfurivibrionaceae bacterium]PKN15971.1 MAG: tRNA (adenosine(37)-N6)-threonylcarbamoyltransferase complex dimerization subunit type